MANACDSCALRTEVARMGVILSRFERVVAVAGNPNTGKSTLFNALTGLKQHTGNWPGKTVRRAEGGFTFANVRCKLVDLPGTYSLLSASHDEEVARDFLLFGRPDATIVVVDATALERNLNLVLQVLEITGRVVVAVNLMDEARRKGIDVDVRSLSRDLGVPAVGIVARTGEGLHALLEAIVGVASGSIVTRPLKITGTAEFRHAVAELVPLVERVAPGVPNARWVAIRLLDGDARVEDALASGRLSELAAVQQRGPERVQPNDRSGRRTVTAEPITAADLVRRAASLRETLQAGFRDEMVRSLYAEAERIAHRAVRATANRRRDFDQRIDRLVTSPLFGLPIMALLLAVVFWITVAGANVPSAMLAAFFFWVEDHGATLFERWDLPWWVVGFFWHGIYRGLAWVVSVMLPPMAIFFPPFTILEDLGYLPRVAFNLDFLFQRAGAHGKQALTMAMGFGCNAAGVIATRVIDSPRERLVAILTNNFVPCNGRYPTLIMLATIFVGAAFPPPFASIAAACAVVAVVIVGVIFTLLVSGTLSRTILRGEASAFTLELPPYRRPGVLRILYTSLVDRTLFVLGRACMTAAPAGAAIWVLGTIHAGGTSLAQHAANALDTLGHAIGLDGAILLAYVIAIPANEIVVPTIAMVYMNTGTMTDLTSFDELKTLLVDGHGWTLLTAVNLMLFALLHNPCATTIWTIYRETLSKKWTAIGALMPLGLAFLVTFLTATIWRIVT